MQRTDHYTNELTLRIAERANQLSQQRAIGPGGELALWREAEAQVKREQSSAGRTLQ